MYGEQGTDDDVTRNVCYNAPLAGLGSLMRLRPHGQEQQQNHGPHGVSSQKQMWAFHAEVTGPEHQLEAPPVILRSSALHLGFIQMSEDSDCG